jgi:nucleotide-binding universal stress UspA family protein
MESLFKIICPIDFSECSLNAIEYASKVGEQYKAHLVLVHVMDREDYSVFFPRDANFKNQNEFVIEKMTSLQKAVQEESLAKGLKSCEILTLEGQIVEEIIRLTQEQKANLIVIGTEGVNNRRPHIVGSKASRVVQESDIDVMVIPRKVYFKIPKKLVYASDYLEEDKLAIQKVVEYASFFDSEIDLVHLSSNNRLIDKALHKSIVEEMLPFVRYEKINFSLRSVRVNFALGLENYVQTSKGDMLVVLSKKKSFFDLIFTSSLSKKMSYFITRPLWVIKSF